MMRIFSPQWGETKRGEARWLALLVILLLTACRQVVIPETLPTLQPTAPAAISLPTQTPIPPTPSPVPPTLTPVLATSTSTTTPQPAPTDTPRDSIAAQLLPTAITPPPAGWTPSRPPGFDAAQHTPESWVQDYLQLVTDMLNSSRDMDSVLDQLVAWMPADSTYEGPRPANAWAANRDLDGDGTDEWLISVPSQDRGCYVTYCPGYVLLYQERDSLFTPLALVLLDEIIWDISFPSLLLIDDVNADGLDEVVLKANECGAHTCYTTLLIGRWDGQRWRDLAADPIQQAYTDYAMEDRDGDGVQEIVMHGGTFGSAGAGLQRPHTLTFDWADGAYRLVADVPDPGEHPYYQIIDANAALTEGKWATTLAHVLPLVENLGVYSDAWTSVEAWSRIVGYASIEAMLVYAHQGDVDAMEDVHFSLVARSHTEPDNPYPDAAWQLLEVYKETGDVLAACQAMEAVIVERAETAEFYEWYGYGTERLPQEMLCPLDGGE